MRHIIKQMRKDLTTKPGVHVQLEIPREIHHRIMALQVSDCLRSGETIYKKDKVLEALLTGVEALEAQDREKE